MTHPIPTPQTKFRIKFNFFCHNSPIIFIYKIIQAFIKLYYFWHWKAPSSCIQKWKKIGVNRGFRKFWREITMSYYEYKTVIFQEICVFQKSCTYTHTYTLTQTLTHTHIIYEKTIWILGLALMCHHSQFQPIIIQLALHVTL